MSYNVTIPVLDQRIADVLTSAFEGGSNYWLGSIEPPFKIYQNYSKGEMYGPGMVERNIISEDGSETGKLNRENIQRGLNLLGTISGGRHLADFVSQNDDADTGDVFLQLILFGDVIYG